jgi:hypothetical protein
MFRLRKAAAPRAARQDATGKAGSNRSSDTAAAASATRRRKPAASKEQAAAGMHMHLYSALSFLYEQK